MRSALFFISIFIYVIAVALIRHSDEWSHTDYWTLLGFGAVGLILVGWRLLKDWARSIK